MYKNLRFLPLVFIFQFIAGPLACAEVRKPRPVIPSPKDVIYKEEIAHPYTRLIRSKRYGEFYFTKEAEEKFGNYKRLCKALGIRKEITKDINVFPRNKDELQIQWRTPKGNPKEAFINLRAISSPDAYITWKKDKAKKVHIEIDYPHTDYMIRIILDCKKNHEVLLAERITKCTMEIPVVGLVNSAQEIKELILPPEKNVLLLNINRDLVCEYNKENASLIKNLDNPILKPDQKDDIIQHFIANAVYHPLGKFRLAAKGKTIILIAEVAAQKILMPLECLDIPLNNLIQKNALKKFFPEEEIFDISDLRILELIQKRTRSFPEGALMPIEEFPLRKDWYIITTPNTCFWTDYFMNYIENQIKLVGWKVITQIPIHIHPWYSLQWLLDDPFGKYWLTHCRIHMVPSGKDIEFFKTRYPESKLYIILSKAVYSDDLEWAVYDNLPGIENALRKLHSFEKDYEGGVLSEKDIKKVNEVLNRLIKSQAIINRYHIEEEKKLAVAPNIDKLLNINRQQSAIKSLIDDYRVNYAWRLSNFSFLIPSLNRCLEQKGWKCTSYGEELGTDIAKKQFYYNMDTTTRMNLSLFIMSELCYVKAEELSSGIEREEYLIGVLGDIVHQLDYLSIKYHHFKEFCGHLRYLSHIIRYHIFEWEKKKIIAQVQLQKGKSYLDRYNLGYYSGISRNKLEEISDMFIGINSERVVELESLVKELSKTHSIKNEEEFILEFEKKLVLKVLEKIFNRDFP